MPVCGMCKNQMPELNELEDANGIRLVCPICGLKESNTVAGLPLDTPFAGKMAQRLLKRAVKFLGDKAPEWAKSAAAKKRTPSGTVIERPDGSAAAHLDLSQFYKDRN
jgi:hypothetical protein